MIRSVFMISLPLLFLAVLLSPEVSAPGTFHPVQAGFSSKCLTEVGICLVLPQPVGTPCACGTYPGTIVE
jgi:hypothetical protein